MKLEDGVSPTIPATSVLTSLVIFALVYGALMVADIYLLTKYARAGIPTKNQSLETIPDEKLSLVGTQD